MELEVSYNENYCLEGRAERQRGATDRDDGEGQAVGTDCVDRHTLFITPLSSYIRLRSTYTYTYSRNVSWRAWVKDVPVAMATGECGIQTRPLRGRGEVHGSECGA